MTVAYNFCPFEASKSILISEGGGGDSLGTKILLALE